MLPSHVDLVSQWRIHAPVACVWAALAEPACWPQWWPSVCGVATVRAGGPDGVGAVHRLDGAARLPGRIVLEVECVEAVRPERLRMRSRGPFDGEAVWLLRAGPGWTDVTQVWRVTPKRRWLAPLLAPLFRWNHGGVMRAGEAGLRRHLEAEQWQGGTATSR